MEHKMKIMKKYVRQLGREVEYAAIPFEISIDTEISRLAMEQMLEIAKKLGLDNGLDFADKYPELNSIICSAFNTPRSWNHEEKE